MPTRQLYFMPKMPLCIRWGYTPPLVYFILLDYLLSFHVCFTMIYLFTILTPRRHILIFICIEAYDAITDYFILIIYAYAASRRRYALRFIRYAELADDALRHICRCRRNISSFFYDVTRHAVIYAMPIVYCHYTLLRACLLLITLRHTDCRHFVVAAPIVERVFVIFSHYFIFFTLLFAVALRRVPYHAFFLILSQIFFIFHISFTLRHLLLRDGFVEVSKRLCYFTIYLVTPPLWCLYGLDI